MIGVLTEPQIRLITLGITPGSTSIKSGLTICCCCLIFSNAMESSRKYLRTVYIPSSFAFLISDGFVDMIPSASVCSFRYSTEISFGLSPLIRSTCTIATFPAPFTRFTILSIEQTSPNNMKITCISSIVQLTSISSMFFTAAIIGLLQPHHKISDSFYLSSFYFAKLFCFALILLHSKLIFQKKRVRLKSNHPITLYSLSYLSLLVQLHLLYHDAQIISMTFSHFPSFQLIYTIILYFLFVIMHYSCVFSTNIFMLFY